MLNALAGCQHSTVRTVGPTLACCALPLGDCLPIESQSRRNNKRNFSEPNNIQRNDTPGTVSGGDKPRGTRATPAGNDLIAATGRPRSAWPMSIGECLRQDTLSGPQTEGDKHRRRVARGHRKCRRFLISATLWRHFTSASSFRRQMSSGRIQIQSSIKSRQSKSECKSEWRASKSENKCHTLCVAHSNWRPVAPMKLELGDIPAQRSATIAQHRQCSAIN